MGHMSLRGRGRERLLIKELVDAARVGPGGSLLLTGPPGAGRSSLLAEATESATDMTVLTAAGVTSETAVPFSGLSELLGPELRNLDHLPTPQAAALRHALGLAENPAPELHIRGAVLGVLARAAAEHPLLVVVDDLHLFDLRSIAALGYAFRRLRKKSVAALLSAESPLVPALDNFGIRRIELGELDSEATAELLADHGWTPPPPVRITATETTGGNPLALVELARRRPAREQFEDLTGTVTVPMPAQQRTAFLRQVAPLPAPTRAFLVVAAAAADEPFGAVLDAAGRLGMAEADLAPAEGAGVVTVRTTHIRFRHPLLRAAIYQDAARHERLAAHRELAEALARCDPDAAAMHRAAATSGIDAELADTLELIARRHPHNVTEIAVKLSAARLSGTAAERHRRTLAAAIAAWRSGHMDLAQDLGTELSTVTEPAVRGALAWLNGLLEMTGNDPVNAFNRLERVAAELKDSTAVHAGLLFMLSIAAAHDAGELAGARRAADTISGMGGPIGRLGELFRLALDGQLPPSRAEPARLHAELPGELDKHGGMRETVVMSLSALGPHPHLTREYGMAVCTSQRDHGMFGTLAINLLWLTDAHIQAGHYDDAWACADEVLQTTRNSGQRAATGRALAQLARIAAVRGDHGACRELAAETLTIAVETGAKVAAAHASWAVAVAALAEGDAHEAFARLVLLTEPSTPFSHELVARLATPDLVEAAVRTEQLELARGVTKEFAGWVERSTMAWAWPHLHRCHALVTDDEDEALRYFALAAEGDNRPFDLARVSLLRGETLRRGRRRAESRAPLRLAVDLFDGQGARRWAEIARAQLRGAGGLGASPRDGSPVSVVLTTQELQVARLAASGLSNKEIGTMLFLSPRTVGYHLYKLFPKLGISTRAQLRNIDFDEIADDTGDPEPDAAL